MKRDDSRYVINEDSRHVRIWAQVTAVRYLIRGSVEGPRGQGWTRASCVAVDINLGSALSMP